MYKKLLNLIKNDQVFEEFFFIGGSAIASYLNHRISYDVDLISEKKLDLKLIEYIVAKYNARFIPDKNEATFRINTGENLRNYKVEFMINGIKLEVFYPNNLMQLEILKKYKQKANEYIGIKRLPLKALGELKLIALFNRNKIRDLYDIYYLFKENVIDCEDIDRYLSLKYYKTFIEFLNEFTDDGSESLDFEDNKEITLDTIKENFKKKYIERCM